MRRDKKSSMLNDDAKTCFKWMKGGERETVGGVNKALSVREKAKMEK